MLLTAARVESGLGNHEAAQVEFSRLMSDGVPIEFRHQALTDLGFALDKLGDYEGGV